MKAKKLVKMNRCKYCKNKENLTVDHKNPKCKGGSDDLSNLQCLCKKCNSLKSGLSDRQVRRLWSWFLWIQKEREKNGSKIYKLN